MSAHALRAVDARFERDGEVLVPAFSVDVALGEHARIAAPAARAASIAARMAAGIVKPTSGTLFIGDYDPRIQPVQAKRLVGFVPFEGAFDDARRACPDRGRLVDLHAALFEVDPQHARATVERVLAGLGSAEPVEFATALALIRPLTLLVLDRPPPDLDARLAALLPQDTAVLCVRTTADVTSRPVRLVGAAP